MLELVHNDPRSWLLHFFKAQQVPRQALEGTGHVYVLAITGGVTYVKIGSTGQPRSRLEALRTEAHRQGGAVTRAWLSPAHPNYRATEAYALTSCRAISPSSSPRSEYFPDLDFATARREAVKASLGIRDTPRVSTTTSAAGQYQPMPGHVLRRLSPSAWDEYWREFELFRQGSRRSRFRWRNSAPARPSHVPESLSHAFGALFQPSAPVIHLPVRRVSS
ncbi:GIY-YIG nuclease family protein [Streptomyces sp. WAC 04229]|uniref:GIY-YIG nuclease family protein n=1 Tax=Streptomyces sp. WAC 04229 TaxID=2203206 RepID=UPI000F7416D1|nr:GIY-YIG nuclease family protein [Streptomyces sp. WAC 04229]